MNVNINDIKNGMTLILEGKLVTIVDFQHVKPGKGPAFVRIKYRDLRTGSTIEDTFNTNLKLEKAHVEKMQMQFLYKENDNYVFMNTNDYSQMEVSSSIIGDDDKFLKEGLVIEIQMYEGEILGIVLPEKIDYKVTETTDAVKGNTTNNAMKDATIESGYTIKVPMFISEGETIIVSTKDGKYVSRA
ncbi:MAG: elongation factor P [Tenericutes bacterium]|nr:elongation factor P [Mycoplasmatota bacterium]